MPTHQPNDEELDPLETADQEDMAEDEVVPSTDDDVHPILTDPDAEIVAEIEKVGIVEDDSPKPKPHMIPRDLIDRELTAEDLWDEGSI